MQEQVLQAESALAARSAELLQTQTAMNEIRGQFQLQQSYYDSLFKTLSAEFVIAVQHICQLEKIMKQSKLPVPPRPDLTNFDLKAPKLPSYMEPMVQEHAANLVAEAAKAVRELQKDSFEDVFCYSVISTI